jgi:hypothetical protein
MPNPQAGGPPLVGCLRLFIQYIRSHPPYLEGVSSIRNLRTRHAVVTKAQLAASEEGFSPISEFLDWLLAFQHDKKWTHTEKSMRVLAPPYLIIL